MSSHRTDNERKLNLNAFLHDTGHHEASWRHPASSVDRVFDLAFRGDAARSPGGAGLGLAIARGLVEAQHGEIAVVNEPGGCRFTVRLPLP